MLMPTADLGVCPGNCSGKGVCLSGTCMCEVRRRPRFFINLFSGNLPTSTLQESLDF